MNGRNELETLAINNGMDPDAADKATAEDLFLNLAYSCDDSSSGWNEITY